MLWLGIDVGGTFTDLVLYDEATGEVVLEKTPSRSRPEMGSFRTRTTVTNQDGHPVMTFISIVLIRRRPSA